MVAKSNDARNTGEVLHHNACRRKLNFSIWFALFIPISKRLDVISGDVCAIFSAQ
jgi:hypothetical protein